MSEQDSQLPPLSMRKQDPGRAYEKLAYRYGKSITASDMSIELALHTYSTAVCNARRPRILLLAIEPVIEFPGGTKAVTGQNT
jgi:hypothetical protein